MGSRLCIGDLVEVIKSKYFLGCRFVVTKIGIRYSSHLTGECRDDGVDGVPEFGKEMGICWDPAHLRKINPPDWNAPMSFEEEGDLPVASPPSKAESALDQLRRLYGYGDYTQADAYRRARREK